MYGSIKAISHLLQSNISFFAHRDSPIVKKAIEEATCSKAYKSLIRRERRPTRSIGEKLSDYQSKKERWAAKVEQAREWLNN